MLSSQEQASSHILGTHPSAPLLTIKENRYNCITLLSDDNIFAFFIIFNYRNIKRLFCLLVY